MPLRVGTAVVLTAFVALAGPARAAPRSAPPQASQPCGTRSGGDYCGDGGPVSAAGLRDRATSLPCPVAASSSPTGRTASCAAS